ncbi:CHAT domain-containing protein, partial [Mastigocoleus testarum]
MKEQRQEAYLQFLMEALQATAESNGNAKIVYPLLKANIDKLNHIFAEMLRYWVNYKFEQVEANKTEYIVVFIGEFSNLIQQFPLGDKASNMEIAITGYESLLNPYTRQAFPRKWGLIQNNLGIAYCRRIVGDRRENIEKAIDFHNAALQVQTRQAFPQDWARTQNNLGLAYADRILGDQRENIEKAIGSYNAALQVYTHQAFPQDWAMIQDNLGIAYADRILGDRRENIEKAIDSYNAALQVYTHQVFPQDWAKTQNNLGSAYINRIKGDKAENVEKAIQIFNSALLVRTHEASPKDWAMTQNNLGVGYCERIVGDRGENIEKAIQSYNTALQVYTHKAFPQDWAKTQNNLGSAYINRIKGDKAENVEKAIQIFNSVLLVRIREASPKDWAMTQNNLGIGYCERIVGNRGENIEKAIQSYDTALQVYTRKAFPQDWAKTQNNLGSTYINRIKGDKAENVEKAIQIFNSALLVRTRKAFPKDWAATQNNLATAYSERIKGEKAGNIEKAIQAFHAALQVRTHEAFPQNYAETLFNLGMIYQDGSRFTSAYNTYKSAISTVELLGGEVIYGEETKRKQVEEWNKLYQRIVEVCLELGEDNQAVEYIERSKTRNLVELILERDSKTIFPSEVVTQLEQLRDEIAKGQYKIQNGTTDNTTALAQYIQELRQQKNNLQERYLPVGSSFNFEKFQTTLKENTAVIEWYITNEGLETFIITCDTVKRLNSYTSTHELQDLENWINEYLNAYNNNKIEWISGLDSRLTQLATILQIEDILKLIPENCSRLVLIPYRFLHLFPLHALPLAGGSFLCDCFSDGVSYAPSCQLLQQINLRQRPNFKSLFAVQNPTEDLLYTDLEVETISSLFSEKEVLQKKQATQTALSQASSQLQEANYLHFSCHVTFNFISPENSFLLLAGGYEDSKLDLSKCLTLGNLFE